MLGPFPRHQAIDSPKVLLAVRVVLSGEVGERDDLRKCADSVGIRQRLKSDGDIGATCSAGVAPRHRVELTDRFYPVGLVRVVGHFGYLLVARSAKHTSELQSLM